MSIPLAFLEPGGVYAGHNDQHREIISIDGETIVFRVTQDALLGRAIRRSEGETYVVKARTFRDWAQKEVA